jgi:hypothetical protein
MVVVKDYGVQDGTTRGVLYLLREGTAESFGVLDGSREMRSSRLDVSRILGSSPMRTSQTSAEFAVMVRRARCRVVDTLSAKSFCERSQFPICVKNWACSRRCSTAGKKSFSRTERLPSKRRNVLAARRRRNRNGLGFWRRREFKEFIRISGMTHVRTSPFYPQSNGKIERWHKSLKREYIRPLTPLTSRHLLMTSSNLGGRSGFSRAAGAGVPSRIVLKITPELSPRNGNVPVAIS